MQGSKHDYNTYEYYHKVLEDLRNKELATLQSIMADWVGVARSEGSLREASDILAGMARMLDASMTRPFELEMQNMVTLATLITHAAWCRTETRGTHGREDFPKRDDAHWHLHTVWRRGAEPTTVPVGEM
jgi:L-aspartate oxidase